MGKFNFVKNAVVYFKLDWCCWFIPVRIGLMIIGYFNIILAVISLLGTADDSFWPILVQVQNVILEDNAKKPLPIMAYSIELAFNVALLCGLYRRDMALLRVYMMYCFAALIASIMFYSMVVAAIGIIVTIAMVFNLAFQGYIIILIRSILVEMTLAQKKQELPTLVMSTLVQEEKERVEKEKADVETPETHGEVEVDVEASETHEVEVKVDVEYKPETKLETVDEHPREETFKTVKMKA